jgi:phosphatidylglycerophosphate synthase
MVNKQHNYTLDQVNAKLVLRSWWASFAVLPFANRLVVLICNYTELTPNQITTISCFFRFFSALCFLTGSRSGLILGAIFYYLGYLIDCIDGPVARLKGKTSNFGRYFDHMSDLIGDILILAALAFGQGVLATFMVVSMIFMHIAESYISYLVNFSFGVVSVSENSSDHSRKYYFLRGFQRYREFFFRRNFKSFLSFPDYEALTLFLFPLLGFPLVGLKIGFCLLLITTLYTIFSSFISIHTGERRFP